jgi:redox-sensitive bicupin YhaK (pirin superfamily)
MSEFRQLTQIVDAQASSDGDGVKMHRVAGRHLNQLLDPFLMLDEFGSEDGADYIGGFPSHPHRGFETITYMLDGAMRHKDHLGNEGVINSGDVQWMTAGRGVIHSEMPEQEDGLLRGFQIWINLPAAEKMQPAGYQEYLADQLPVVEYSEDVKVKIIAGELQHVNDDGEQQVSSPIKLGSTDPSYFDIHFSAGARFQQSFPAGHMVAVYVYEGATTELAYRQMGFYPQGEVLSIVAGDQGAKIILLAAKPIKEPIAQYGPFVMNTREEIEQAIQDYNSGALVE